MSNDAVENVKHAETEQQANPKQLIASVISAALIGILAAILASLFLGAVEAGQHAFFETIPHSLGIEGNPLYVGALLLIASLVIYLARTMIGHTGAGPLTGFHFDVPAKAVPSALIAAFASLVAGVALGPEAPLILLGVALGGVLFARRPEKVRKAMMFVGGAAAISAVFGNPFITGFMILEFVALGAVPTVLILPVFTALASGYLVTIGIWNIPGVGAHPLTVPGLPDYANINPGDILVGLGVAVLAALVALAARAGGEFVDHLAKKRGTLVLFGSAIVTAIVLAIAESIFGISQDQILFSGNSGMPGLIAETSAGIVIIVIIAKTLTYSVALGAGFRGGPIFPVTFLGVAVGVLVALLVPGMNASAMAAAGISAASAAFLKLPATSALLGALLIAGTGPAIAPFAIFGAVIGFVVRLSSDALRAKKTPRPTPSAKR